MSSPLVSCIIPTKNRPELLKKAIESVMNQTYRNIEIIVIDDSDNTESEEMLASNKFPVQYLKNKESKGAPYSRNIGIKTSTGEYLSFLDDDDIWEPCKIETQLKHIGDSSIISCNFLGILPHKIEKVLLPEWVTLREQATVNYLGSCSFVMVSRKGLGNLQFDERLKSGQDWELWINIMKTNKIERVKCIQQYLVRYNCGLHERISLQKRRLTDWAKIYEKHEELYDAKMVKAFYAGSLTSLSASFWENLVLDYIRVSNSNKSFWVYLLVRLKTLFGYRFIY